MRVVTQNLWGWYYPLEGRGIGRGRPGGPRPAAWSARRSVLAEGLRALDPDLVAFQEVIRHEDYDQVTDLLGPGYEVVHQTRREADGSGVSIASRWPLGEVHELDLQVTPRSAGFLAVALVAEVQAPPPIGPLLFVNHKPNFELALEHERGLQAVITASLLERLVSGRELHVVVAGDFDAAPDAASMRFWHGRQALSDTSVCYRDAWEHTHPERPRPYLHPGQPDGGRGHLAAGAGTPDRPRAGPLRRARPQPGHYRLRADLRPAGGGRLGQRPLRGRRRPRGGAARADGPD